jgi:choice-of-anchor B domain-containing protein
MRTSFYFLILLLEISSLNGQGALNVSLFGQYHRGDLRYSGCWTYLAPDNSEYALLGARTGTAVYSIAVPGNIQEVAFIAGVETNWREITSIGQYAYVVTDVGNLDHVLQVIDLSNLPNSASLLTTYSETFTKGHIIQKDIFSDDPYIYVCGTSTTSGVHILDVSDPAHPLEVGLYQPGYYIHDCHVRGDLMFAAAFYEGTMDILDISDKTDPVLLARLPVPGGNVHSSSLTIDGRYLFIAPELDGLPGRIWNVEDLDNVYEVATYTANSSSLVHNPYIRGDFAFISHNTEGLRVVDIADPEAPVEVGFYDTYDGPSGGFHGLWSACPYLPSGKIIGGNREDGLYVWEFNNARAGRLYGLVRDSLSGTPILSAGISILEVQESFLSGLDGRFRYGALPGDFTLIVSANGYHSKTLSFSLEEGSQEEVVVELVPTEVTGASEPANIEAIPVYPNPFGSRLNFDLHSIPEASTLLLSNASGAIVLSLKINGQLVVSVDRGGLPSGVYFYEIRDKEGRVIARGKALGD